jgi:hypothetical protein
MFLCNVIGGYKDQRSIKISLYISDVMFDQTKFRNNYLALILDLENKVTSFIDEVGMGAKGTGDPVYRSD